MFPAIPNSPALRPGGSSTAPRARATAPQLRAGLLGTAPVWVCCHASCLRRPPASTGVSARAPASVGLLTQPSRRLRRVACLTPPVSRDRSRAAARGARPPSGPASRWRGFGPRSLRQDCRAGQAGLPSPHGASQLCRRGAPRRRRAGAQAMLERAAPRRAGLAAPGPPGPYVCRYPRGKKLPPARPAAPRPWGNCGLTASRFARGPCWGRGQVCPASPVFFSAPLRASRCARGQRPRQPVGCHVLCGAPRARPPLL